MTCSLCVHVACVFYPASIACLYLLCELQNNFVDHTIKIHHAIFHIICDAIEKLSSKSNESAASKFISISIIFVPARRIQCWSYEIHIGAEVSM